MKNKNTGRKKGNKGNKDLKNAVVTGASGGASRAITSKVLDWVSGLLNNLFESE